jgi:hypothetical protein
MGRSSVGGAAQAGPVAPDPSTVTVASKGAERRESSRGEVEDCTTRPLTVIAKSAMANAMRSLILMKQ